jgi:succinate dehydrogenase/fumarate reductase flavoprotein subunit
MYVDHNGLWGLNILRGFDWKKKPIRIAPICMGDFKGGGGRIDENGRTDVQGLFAGGDVAPGSSMLYALMTGVRSGRSAVNRALSLSMPELDAKVNEWVDERGEELKVIFHRKPNKNGDPQKIKNEVKSIMWRYGGVFREEKGLKEGIKGLKEIDQDFLPTIFASGSFRKLREAVEAINMVKVGEMILKASLFRTESRGYLQRLDYPKQDDKNWLKKNSIITKGEDEMKIEAKPVDLIWVRPDEVHEGER